MTPIVHSATVRNDFRKLGFRYADDTVMAFIGGSQLHGAKLDAKDDYDWYGVFIEPPSAALGVDAASKENQHFVFTTGGERGGNRPDDTDICLYSLAKWARLACVGNPSVLHFWFAKPEMEHPAWIRIASHASYFMAKSHVESFLGFANAQFRRLTNQRARDVNRPDLESEFGFDTKYAMHIVRLFLEAREFLADGKITLPNPRRDLLIAIRTGQFNLPEIEQMSRDLERDVWAAHASSPLPQSVDRSAVSALVSSVYLDYWLSTK